MRRCPGDLHLSLGPRTDRTLHMGWFLVCTHELERAGDVERTSSSLWLFSSAPGRFVITLLLLVCVASVVYICSPTNPTSAALAMGSIFRGVNHQQHRGVRPGWKLWDVMAAVLSVIASFQQRPQRWHSYVLELICCKSTKLCRKRGKC